MPSFIDITGQTFNTLTVISLSPDRRANGERYWVCLCVCGRSVTVRGTQLRGLKTLSCGCLRTVALKKRATHTGSGTPEYVTWQAMKARCHNPNSTKYYMYGARGIYVCVEWRNSFEAFLQDMGKRPTGQHTIDRIDSSLGYYKGNCIWSDKEAQANNTRLNRPIKYLGETLNLNQWSRRLKIPAPTLINRLGHRHLTVEEAFTLKPFQRGAKANTKR